MIYVQNNYPIKWTVNGYPDCINSNFEVVKRSEIVNCLFSELPFCRQLMPKRDTELSVLLKETRNNFVIFCSKFKKIIREMCWKNKAGLLVHILVFLLRVLKKTVLQKFEVSVAAVTMCRDISVTFLFRPFRLAPLTQ